MENQTGFLASKKYLYLFAVISGVLFFLPWVSRIPFTILFAFAPLLAIEKRLAQKPGFTYLLSLFLCCFICFFITNIGATYWLFPAAGPMAVGIWIYNAIFISLPIILFSVVKKKSQGKYGYLALVCFWLGFEYLQNHWFLGWPWLNLGSAFMRQFFWVQWYEIVGISGGTLWIIISGIVAYQILFLRRKRWLWAIFIYLPIFYSYLFIEKDPTQSKTEKPASISIEAVGKHFAEKHHESAFKISEPFFYCFLNDVENDNFLLNNDSEEMENILLIETSTASNPDKFAELVDKNKSELILVEQGNMPYKIQNAYLRLRAIENRVNIIFKYDANQYRLIPSTGIDRYWDTDKQKSLNFYPSATQTSFTTYQNLIGRLAAFIGIFILLITLVKNKLGKFSNK
ncbi:hypothetical protein [Flexithrix dorotheae]|uniref:hypothetical protein n=1 Tax=Flexithrix dorotheae TaxID=70993 RepID=UPI00035FF7FE|nr:hypothetical protein [Flexithrix dorotheae]